MNISARQLESILNQETPGVFLVQLEGGKRGRFTYLFDPQSRIPVSSFGINAGEKGLIFAYDESLFSSDTRLAQKYGYTDLNWFYRQWVTQTYLPSYELSYHFEADTTGGGILKGELLQKGIPESEKWFMPLPLLLHFHGGEIARSTVAVLGARTPISIKLPQAPEKVELDPSLWILSDKTSTTKQ